MDRAGVQEPHKGSGVVLRVQAWWEWGRSQEDLLDLGGGGEGVLRFWPSTGRDEGVPGGPVPRAVQAAWGHVQWREETLELGRWREETLELGSV